MAETELTRGLQSELEEVRGKLDRWIEEQMTQLNQGKVQHEEVMKRLNGECMCAYASYCHMLTQLLD